MKLYSTAKFSKLIGLSPSRLRQAIRSGEITARKRGRGPVGRYVFTRSDLRRYLRSLRVVGGVPASASKRRPIAVSDSSVKRRPRRGVARDVLHFV